MRALLTYLRKSWINKLLVGIPLLLVSMLLLLGAEGMASLLLFSVVCTFGVGGLFWALCSFILGLVLEAILVSVYKEDSIPEINMEHKTASNMPIDSDTLSIWKYIKDARAYGSSDAEIKACLVSAGWSQEKITEAYNLPQ